MQRFIFIVFFLGSFTMSYKLAPKSEDSVLKASERVAKLRTKYSVSSGKSQAQKALGGIPNKLKPKARPKDPLDTMTDYRSALRNSSESLFANMMKTKPRSVSQGSIVEEDGTELSYPEKAQGSLSSLAINQIEKMSEKYGIPSNEFYRIIQGESSMDTKAINPESKAVTLVQFIPTQFQKGGVFEDKGITAKQASDMSDVKQLELYEEYLDYWGYDGSVPLAILQAAPNKLDDVKNNPDTVIYKKGSKAWKQNPNWRTEGDGDITGQSVMDYFERVSR
jgi:hypothetical protein